VHEALSLTGSATQTQSENRLGGTGTGESLHNLAEAHCKEMNRPVRTRNAGWCGRSLGAIRVPIPIAR